MQSVVLATAKFGNGEKLTKEELALLPGSLQKIEADGKQAEMTKSSEDGSDTELIPAKQAVKVPAKK